MFGLPGVSGVGVSFGADRIYDVLLGLNLFPESIGASVQVIFLNLGENEAVASLKAVETLRAAGIAAELYPDAAKMKKQMAYANSLSIPYVGIIGEQELADGTVTIKNMQSGEQQSIPVADIVNAVK